jgi:DNA-binding transcriptional LysR family regulator
MHLETLKTFCDLVETGSFSRAAALNFISQSAVSQQVRALERRFNQQLIERSRRRGVVLTEAGRQLYREARELVERFESLVQSLGAQSEVRTGTIRVATVYSVGLHELPPYVKQFIRSHPQINIRVEYSRTNKVYEACLESAIDFGIVAYPVRRPRLEIIPFREDQLVLVCSPDHHLARHRRISLQSLRGEPFVAFERDIPTRKAIDQIFKQHGVEVNYVMEFDNIETIKRSVEVGIGVSILPDTTVANETRAGLLASAGFKEGKFNRPIGIIHRRGRAFSPAALEFVRLLTGSPELSG